MQLIRKLFIVAIPTLVGFFALMGTMAFAQGQQDGLPPAGLTPESSFYFLERWGEVLQETFTFDPGAKAQLEITFATKRVAEIRAMSESKGIQTRGVEMARNLLNNDLARSTAILAEQKNQGKDVSLLAKELDDKFAGPKAALEQVFEKQKQTLEVKMNELEVKIEAARKLGDTSQAAALAQELATVRAQKELIGQKKDEQKKDLAERGEALDSQMAAKDEAAKKITEMGKEKAKIISESQKEGLVVPAAVFTQFDNLLAQAQTALDSSQYEQARQLVKQARKNLEDVDGKVEDLKKANEKDKELKDKVSEQQAKTAETLKETSQKNTEKIKEGIKQSEEKLKQDQEKVREEIKHAQEQLQQTGLEVKD